MFKIPDSSGATFAQRRSQRALSALSYPCFANPARWAGLLHLAPSAQKAISMISGVRYVVTTVKEGSSRRALGALAYGRANVRSPAP